ncbi:MAG: hypoxanthine phosphoribosyltransferase [Gemmatimonadota bacterium]
MREPRVAPVSGRLDAPPVVFSERRIAERVAELGEEITRHYRESEELLVLGLLKGSFIFLADLVRTIELPLQVDFLIASSYGSETSSSGRVKLLLDTNVSLRNRDVLVVEDIVDSGVTLRNIVPLLQARGPRSLEICALLHKRTVTLEKEPKWVGFEAPADFLVGYGLDHAERFRHLPFIGSL